MTYDSTQDTLDHIDKVQTNINTIIQFLKHARNVHDQSKLLPPEKELFDEWTPKLAKLTYGSTEYQIALQELKPALDHHYASNSHHPEHYENGISEMTLMDVAEMLCDWKAATERHNDGDIQTSLKINKERFNISDQLLSILSNTVDELGW